MTTTRSPDAWSGNAAFQTVEKTRLKASELKDNGYFAESDTVLLSAYIGSLNNIRSGSEPTTRLHRLITIADWTLRGEYHAICLRERAHKLTYSQLEVLATWLVVTSKFFWLRKHAALHYARRSLSDVRHNGGAKPHQIALAWITYARASALYRAESTVRISIKMALAFETEIRREPDQLLALRQYVRCLKNAATLELKMGDHTSAKVHLLAALELAEGSADTESQAEPIRLLLAEYSLEA